MNRAETRVILKETGRGSSENAQNTTKNELLILKVQALKLSFNVIFQITQWKKNESTKCPIIMYILSLTIIYRDCCWIE